MATTRPVTDDEYLSILDHCHGDMALRNRCLIVQLREWGPRISEALSLRVGQVLDQGQVLPQFSVAARHVKTGRGYLADINETARRMMARWLMAAGEQGHMTADAYVFHVQGRPSVPMSACSAWKMIQQAAKAGGAGLIGSIGPHSFRKAYGLWVYRTSGNDIMAAKEALRHESVESTRKYLRIEAERVKALVLSHSVTLRE